MQVCIYVHTYMYVCVYVCMCVCICLRLYQGPASLGVCRLTAERFDATWCQWQVSRSSCGFFAGCSETYVATRACFVGCSLSTWKMPKSLFSRFRVVAGGCARWDLGPQKRSDFGQLLCYIGRRAETISPPNTSSVPNLCWHFSVTTSSPSSTASA